MTLAQPPYGPPIPEQYMKYFNIAVAQMDERHNAKIRDMEEKVRVAELKAKSYEDFYLSAIDQAVELEIELKTLQRSIERGN